MKSMFNRSIFIVISIGIFLGCSGGEKSGESSNHVLSQKSNIGNLHIDMNFIGFATMAIHDESWSDFEFTAEIMSKDDDHIGMVFRYQDLLNYYAFVMDNPNDNEPTGTCLVKVEDGVLTWLTAQGVDEAYTRGAWYRIQIAASGETIKVLKDGALLFNVKDDSFASGGIGFASDYNEGAYFDNVNVSVDGENVYQENFDDGVNDWKILDVEEADNAPSKWGTDTI